MVKYYKKDGGRMVETEADDQEASEVRMALEEYREIKKALDEASHDRAYQYGLKKAAYEALDDTQSKLESEIAENQRKDQIIKDLDQKIALLNERTWDLETKNQNEMELNKNMVRIMRERSNKENGLSKNYNGYIVLDMSQTTVQYQHILTRSEYDDMPEAFRTLNDFPCYDRKNVIVWKTKIQTYFSIMLPFETIKNRVVEELFTEILPSMGCKCMLEHEDDIGKFASFNAENGFFNYSFHANCKTQKWEIDIMTTGPLILDKSRIPAEK